MSGAPYRRMVGGFDRDLSSVFCRAMFNAGNEKKERRVSKDARVVSNNVFGTWQDSGLTQRNSD